MGLVALVWAAGVLACAPDSTSGNQLDAQLLGTPLRGTVTARLEIYNPHSREDLDAVREMGFTQVVLDWPTLHDEAAEMGLDVVLANWWTEETAEAEIQRGVELARQADPRHLAAVSMMDEPERYAPATSFAFYQALYFDLRRQLPGVPLEISHWGPLASWSKDDYERFVPLYQATDRIRLMPYPDLEEQPLNEVFLQMMRSRYLMELAGTELPQVVILQAWVLPENPKLPTIDELRVMAYQALLGGAHTVSFYHYDLPTWERTPGFREEFAALVGELSTFARQHAGVPVEAVLRADGVLEATLSPAGEQPWRMWINTQREPVAGLAALEVRGHTGPASLGAEPAAREATRPMVATAAGRRSCTAQPLSCRPLRRGLSRLCR